MLIMIKAKLNAMKKPKFHCQELKYLVQEAKKQIVS